MTDYVWGTCVELSPEYLHKYTCDGRGCVTDYVWGTCVELIPGYLSDCRSLAEVESIKQLKCRVGVYKRDI